MTQLQPPSPWTGWAANFSRPAFHLKTNQDWDPFEPDAVKQRLTRPRPARNLHLAGPPFPPLPGYVKPELYRGKLRFYLCLIIDCHLAGETAPVIAERVYDFMMLQLDPLRDTYRPTAARIGELLRRIKITPKPSPPPVTLPPELAIKAFELRQNGATYKAITEQLGLATWDKTPTTAARLVVRGHSILYAHMAETRRLWYHGRRRLGHPLPLPGDAELYGTWIGDTDDFTLGDDTWLTKVTSST
jgi:hypothetical protein